MVNSCRLHQIIGSVTPVWAAAVWQRISPERQGNHVPAAAGTGVPVSAS